MMDYKISIIVPIYNGEKYLRRAIESIINQTLGFNNIELILIDDCSKDNSKNIILEYSDKYDNILPILLEKNSGFPGKPRNMGLSKATGKYIMFFDVDDCYLPEACEILYNAITENDVDLVMGNYYLNSNGNIMENKLCPKNYGDLIKCKPTNNQKIFSLVTNMTCISPWAKIYKSDFIRRNNLKFSINTNFEECKFYFEAILNSNNICILANEYLYCYNEYADSSIHNHTKDLFYSFFRGFKEVNQMLVDDSRVSNESFLNEHLQSLLLIFVNTKISVEERKSLLQEIYDFEKDYNNIKINNSEIALLNQAILDKKFDKAIRLANLYSFLYNNKFIKRLYRKYNNYKRGN